MEIVKNPKYPRGRNMNPCIDCRIFTFKKAKEFMEEIGASFIITGEVTGQRPMSQRKQAIMTIEKESGLEGLIVRPLSAKFFEPTLPEKSGIIDRDKLLDIDGRRRTRQIALAKGFGINDYPCPAGGCLLTDKCFSERLKDLLKYNARYDISDLHLLKIGRHFKISDELRFLVGRDEQENAKLMSFSKAGDYIFDILDIPSAVGLSRGKVTENDIERMASILARYSDSNGKSVIVSYRQLPGQDWKNTTAVPAAKNLTEAFHI
jgi:tRNA-uridine 2-sulfurtransferase